MAEHTITLTDIEEKAFTYLSIDQITWITDAFQNRALVAINEIVDIYTKRALDEGVQIPATRELIVADAFTRGWVKTAQQRNEEAQSNRPE
jgi:hypothetical protein